MKIIIDAMGGDYGVTPSVQGTIQALQYKNFEAFIVGDEEQIKPLIPSKLLNRQIHIVHSLDYIRMEEQASSAIKRQESSIYVGIELLKNNQADALVSAGHSGATMSLATLKLGRIQGVSRPAICTTMPTITNSYSLILDAGANTDCKPEYLLDFALMGYEYCKNVMGIAEPKVGLLSNGEEESKGNELTKEAFLLLKKYPFFVGNVEGKNIYDGSVDVIVCDGFSGNLVLKASEGVAQTIVKLIKREIKKSFCAKIGALMMQKVFKTLKNKVDYSEYGGAPLLGVNKNVIISHGSSNSRAIECAIYQAIHAVESDICNKIKQTFVHKERF